MRFYGRREGGCWGGGEARGVVEGTPKKPRGRKITPNARGSPGLAAPRARMGGWGAEGPAGGPEVRRGCSVGQGTAHPRLSKPKFGACGGFASPVPRGTRPGDAGDAGRWWRVRLGIGIGIYGIYSVGVGRRMRRVALMGSDID